MPSPSFPPILISPPSDAEPTAPAVVVGYVTRSGTQAASLRLATRPGPAEAVLLCGPRDQPLARAARCDGLRDLAADRPGIGEGGPRWTRRNRRPCGSSRAPRS